MAVEILVSDSSFPKACFYCNTSMIAFGPVFGTTAGWSAEETAQAFEVFCREKGTTDLRHLTPNQLYYLYIKFMESVVEDYDLMLSYVESY